MLARQLQTHDHQSCWSYRLGTWNVEIAVCCRAESIVSSVFGVWSAELAQIIRCGAMNSFEDWRQSLYDPTRSTQPMKSVTQKTGHGCQLTMQNGRQVVLPQEKAQHRAAVNTVHLLFTNLANLGYTRFVTTDRHLSVLIRSTTLLQYDYHMALSTA